MGRSCNVCESPKHREVDDALARGTDCAAVGRAFGISEHSVRRHKAAHLSPALVSLTSAAVVTGEPLDLQIRSVVGEVRAALPQIQVFIDSAANAADAVGWRNGNLISGLASLMGEMRKRLELLARLTGELNTAAQTNVQINVLSNPEVQNTFSDIMRALDPWPEAKLAVAAALMPRGALPPGNPVGES